MRKSQPAPTPESILLLLADESISRTNGGMTLLRDLLPGTASVQCLGHRPPNTTRTSWGETEPIKCGVR